jgi:TatD DNase family protein
MLVDTHTHLDLPDFDHDREAVIDEARAMGVSAMIVIGFNEERWQSTAKLCDTYPFLVRTVGLHPNEADAWTPELGDRLARALDDPSVVAVGEIGLDFYRESSSRDKQREAFEAQLQIAKRLGLPVVIHQRQAGAEVVEMLRSAGIERGVMHCFDQGPAFANECVDLGFYLGIGGVVTHKRAGHVREAVAAVPLAALVTETDCPYLTPEPYRGERNDPRHLDLIVQAVAEARREPNGSEAISRATTESAVRLFGPRLEQAMLAGEGSG